MLEETDESHMISSSNTYVLSNYLQGDAEAEDQITFGNNESYDLLLTPASCNINIVFNSSNSVVTYPLMGTYDSAQKVTVDEEGNTTEAGGTQQYYTMAMGQKWVQDSDGNTLLRSVVVAGSTTMLVQSFLESSTFDNRDYMNDMFLYLTDYSASSNKVTSARIQTNVSDITATLAMCNFLGFWVFTIGIPAVLLIVGVVVWLKRRHL